MSRFRKERNEAFFNQQSSAGAGGVQHSTQSLNAVLRGCRTSGTLSLTNRNLTSVPLQIFNSELEEGVKFWEAVGLAKLDLSFNALMDLPEQFRVLEELQSLKVRGNRLEELHSAIFECLQLCQLDAGQNQLRRLSPRLGALTMLQELSVPENRLTDVPQELQHCQQLQVLNLYGNQIATLPIELRLPRLLELNVGKNRLLSLPELRFCPALEVLVCCRNGLTALPDMSQLSSLKVCDAMENRLERFPRIPSPQGASALSIVNLGFNALPSIDMEALLRQQNLAELHLQNNRLCILEAGISALPALKLLDVSNNDIRDVPSDLGYADALQILVVEGNPIRTIRRTLISRSDANTTSELKKFLRSRGEAPQHTTSKDQVGAALSAEDYRIRDIAEGGVLQLSKCKLGQEFPHSLIEKLFASHTLEVLKTIDLTSNGLELVPGEFGQIGTLDTLILTGNELGRGLDSGRWQASDGQWMAPSLRCLEISSNRLNYGHTQQLLPCMQRLQCLKLSRNLIDVMPQDLLHIQNLRELDLSFNHISRLELDFSFISNLEVLDVSNNRIDFIADSLLSCNRLRVVDLQNNNLKEVPFGFGFMDSLQSLALQGCPLRAIRQAVINGPIENLKQALRNKAPGQAAW